MSSSKINAAILLLKSKAVETYGVIKEISAKPSEVGDAERIATLALSLVQFEGAMLTLQQYSEDLLSDPVPAPTPEPPAPVEEKTLVPTPERSPTLKASQQRKVRKSK
jgi:hypothetical protein|tara:strand:- start:1884 stop:2207 length:324 start_codon:yes stop_codon:yes gene_type:complete